VALQLAQHGGHRVAGETLAAVRVVAVDRLQQPQAGHLDEILQRLARVAVASGQLACERYEAQRELLASGEIALAVVPQQQTSVLQRPLLGRLRRRRLVSRDGNCHSYSTSSSNTDQLNYHPSGGRRNYVVRSR
jgi:hypothetical protein